MGNDNKSTRKEVRLTPQDFEIDSSGQLVVGKGTLEKLVGPGLSPTKALPIYISITVSGEW